MPKPHLLYVADHVLLLLGLFAGDRRDRPALRFRAADPPDDGRIASRYEGADGRKGQGDDQGALGTRVRRLGPALRLRLLCADRICLRHGARLPGGDRCAPERNGGGTWDAGDGPARLLCREQGRHEGRVLADVAAGIGIDREAFLRDFESEEAAEETWTDFSLAQRAGITGFPTLLAGAEEGAPYAMVTQGFQPAEVIIPPLERWLLALDERSASGALLS